MRIAVCDDDAQDLLHISKLVSEYLSGKPSPGRTELVGFVSGLELISQLDSGRSFDVFLLDIIMPKMNGMQLAAEIRGRDQVAKIIFLTSSAEYAVESYSVGAFGYLLKPIQGDKLFPVLGRVCNDISRMQGQQIVVRTRAGFSKLLFDEITYVEVLSRTVYFHRTSGATLESTSTISQVGTVLLADNRFIKPHRSYIVNLDYARSLSEDSFRMTDSACVPISRNVIKPTKQAYMNHSFQTEGWGKLST